MSLTYLLAGAVTATSATVLASTTDFAAPIRAAYRVVGSPSWSWTSATATDAQGYAKVVIPGLATNQIYEYQFEIAGSLDPALGKFRTHPAPVGTPTSFTFAFASCSGPVSLTTSPTNHPVYDSIREDDPLFFAHLGDFHYQNIGTNDPALFRTAYHDVITQPRAKAMYASSALVYVWDDHDFGPNDSNRTSASRPAAASAYRQCFPHYPLEIPASNNGIYHAFTVGRVRFIATDQRFYRDPHNQSEAGAPRTMLGATQKAWFKQQITDAAADPDIIYTFWLSSQVPVEYGGDIPAWSSYQTELRELWDHFKSAGIVGKLAAVAGDVHASVLWANYDFSSDSQFPGGVPVMSASPIEQYSLYQPTAAVPNLTAVAASQGQHGLITVQDDPASDRLFVELKSYSTDDDGAVRLNFTHTLLDRKTPPAGDYKFYDYDESVGRWFRRPVYFHDGAEWVPSKHIASQ